MQIERLFETGAITGPYRKAQPVSHSILMMIVREWLHDVKYAFICGVNGWKFARKMRAGWNPDDLEF